MFNNVISNNLVELDITYQIVFDTVGREDNPETMR